MLAIERDGDGKKLAGVLISAVNRGGIDHRSSEAYHANRK
jgi:hypothetical protein